MRIAASTFLVTGGSSGLGAACVQMLSEEGANAIIADLNAAENIMLNGELIRLDGALRMAPK